MTEETHIDAQPHSVGAEKAVLSVLMQFPALWHDRGDLVPEWCYLPQNRLICAEIFDVLESGGQLELVSFIQRLLDGGKLNAIGGAGYVSEIYTYQPSGSSFQQHIEILRHKQACRMAIEAANRIIETANQSPEMAELIEVTGNPITELHNVITGSKPAPDAKELGRKWWSDFQKLMSGEKLPMGIATGIREIDNALRGLNAGMMGVVSARSSGGKSTLATQIMCGSASKESPVIYLPLEGTVDAAYSRCIIQLSGLHCAAITSPAEYAQLNGRKAISKEETDKIARALKRITTGGFHFDPPANRKIQTILSTIRRAHRKYSIKVAIIDYVQLIRGDKAASKEQEIMGISNAIQELAAELGIFVLLLSQENSEGETKHARAIEEDSDWTISIVQNQDKKSDNYKQHQHCLITKDRHNGKGGEKLPLILDREHVRFITGIPPNDDKRKTKRYEDF